MSLTRQFAQRLFPVFALTALMLVAALTAASVSASATNDPRPLGDSKVFTMLPAEPGYPESLAVNGNRVYVSGPAQFGYFVQPKVLAYDLDTGALVAEYTIEGQIPTVPKAGTGIAFGKNDMLYVGDLQQGVVRFDVDQPNAQQQPYASALPDLPMCSRAAAPCTPTTTDRAPLINDLVFDKDGNLYISDSMQATIWRVAPGGGAPQVWYQDARLDTDFGANGMRFNPKGDKLYFSVTFGQMGQGFIYTLPRVSNPSTSDLKTFYTYEPGAGPDGIAFGKSGKLYVALAVTNQISVLRPDATEELPRYSGPAATGDPSKPLPWANPSAIAFNDKTRSLLVANHAIFYPNASDFFAIFDVFVDDKADHLARPNIP